MKGLEKVAFCELEEFADVVSRTFPFPHSEEQQLWVQIPSDYGMWL